MTATQIVETLRSQGFEAEMLCSDMVLVEVGLDREISIMEVERALPNTFSCKHIIQTTDRLKVRIHI